MRERGQKSNLAEEDTSDVIGIENDETQFSDSEETEFPENFESNDGPVPPIVPTTSSAPPPVATVSQLPLQHPPLQLEKNDSLAPTSQKKEKTKTPPIKQTASSQVLQAYLASKKKPEDDHLSKFFCGYGSDSKENEAHFSD
ncbi:unnamed protein product [Bemisia tabaci]|uniref:Uncharacterized protein n=1 Tax=Bemisia tabaci TaxID=7038 RepID=A0A9P0A5T0_BEMTA|nr:unnamed protein product [Bemisia tabaci]